MDAHYSSKAPYTGSEMQSNLFHWKKMASGEDLHQQMNTGSRYGSGTVGGMSELSYSISDAGTQGYNMTGSAFSNKFMAMSNSNPYGSTQPHQ